MMKMLDMKTDFFGKTLLTNTIFINLPILGCSIELCVKKTNLYCNFVSTLKGSKKETKEMVW